MDHTFLFEEWDWAVTGEMIDIDQNVIPFEGEARITHSKRLWINSGYMKLSLPSGEKTEFQNNFEIIPFSPDRDYTIWSAVNPVLGRLAGRFNIIDDSIISIFESEDGEYKGSEYLLKVSETRYRNRGIIYKGDDRLSSWAAELVRVVKRLH